MTDSSEYLMSRVVAEGFDDPYRTPYLACPLCGGAPRWLRDQPWTVRPDYKAPLTPVIRWMECGGCGHQFTWGYHTDEALKIIFSEASAMQTPVGMTGASMESARWSWVSLIDAVGLLRPEGRWLDVGAGSGMLLALAAECGYEIAALELRDDVADALGRLGIRVRQEQVQDLAKGPAGQFDIISLCDVLEHVAFPLPVLDAVTHALSINGVLAISCPNRDSLVWRQLDAEDVNPYWLEIEHFHNFSFRQIRQFLSERGYTKIRCTVSPRYRICMDVTALRGPSTR
jgi:protein O-GlcNAc transferase